MIRLPATLLFSAFFLAAWMQAQTSVDGARALGSRAPIPESPRLEVTGSCPGGVLIDVFGMTPAGRVVLGASLGRGTSVVPSGPCAGTILDLAEARMVVVLQADFLGEAGLVTAIQNSEACGTISLQALDLATCLVTEPVRL